MEAVMSTKALTLLLVVGLFVPIVYSQAVDNEKNRANPPYREIESFYTRLQPSSYDTVLVLGKNESFILTDYYTATWDSRVHMEIIRNSSIQLFLRSDSQVNYQMLLFIRVTFGLGLNLHSKQPGLEMNPAGVLQKQNQHGVNGNHRYSAFSASFNS
jgi:hypothetical protein